MRIRPILTRTPDVSVRAPREGRPHAEALGQHRLEVERPADREVQRDDLEDQHDDRQEASSTVARAVEAVAVEQQVVLAQAQRDERSARSRDR